MRGFLASILLLTSDFGFAAAAVADFPFSALEHGKLGRQHGGLAVELDFAVAHDDGEVVRGGNGDGCFRAFVHGDVPHIQLGEGVAAPRLPW